MKKESLLAIALIATASANVFSLEIVKGRLLEHKQWSTNSKSMPTFTEATFDRKKLTYLRNTHKNDLNAYIYATARMNSIPSSVNVGDQVDVNGVTSVFIGNYSLTSKKYTITEGVCTGPISQLQGCSMSSNVIQLDSGGYLSLSSKPDRNITFDTLGVYGVSVYTDITNDDNDSSVFSTDDYHWIDVIEPSKK